VGVGVGRQEHLEIDPIAADLADHVAHDRRRGNRLDGWGRLRFSLINQ